MSAKTLRLLSLAVTWLTLATPALAQAPVAAPVSAADAGDRQTPAFLPDYDFHLSAEYLSSDDERFVWDARFGGRLDLFEYGRGRGSFTANYQAILGDEFRRFDPNQGNYELAGSLSARVSGIEAAGMFYHQSRHLSDRPKRRPVDWNMLGARVGTHGIRGRLQLEGLADLRGVIKKSFVDYRWEIAGELRTRYRMASSLSVIGSGAVRLLGTDGSQARGTQVGGRGEGGLRLEGVAAAIELFIAVERRIDPYPLEFGHETWLTAGFRLLDR